MTTTVLTWASSGNGAKTGVAIANLLNDLDTLITSKSGDASFSWQKAGKVTTGATPYLLLSRKDASVGRIAIMYFTVIPANGNAAVFDQAPNADLVFIAYFPNGNANVLSNLTAASGTMCGDDTNAVKASSSYDIGDVYQAGYLPFYFDSYDAMWFFFGQTASNSPFGLGAGALLEDNSGNPVNATFGSYYATMNAPGGASLGAWSDTFTPAGSPTTGFRVNYPSASTPSKQYFAAFSIASWCNFLPSQLTDILSDPANNKYWYAPISLIGQTKGEGVVLKIRQLGYGSGSTSPFAVYYTTGPVAQSRQACNCAAGGPGNPWFTNFKI